MNDLFARIAHSRQALEAFLEEIESGSVEAANLEEAWARCAASFQALGDLESLGEAAQHEEAGLLREQLVELVRLNAIAFAALERDRGRIGNLMGLTKRARKALAHYVPSVRTGGTCDFSG